MKGKKANPVSIHQVRANLRWAKELQNIADDLKRIAQELLQEARINLAKMDKFNRKSP